MKVRRKSTSELLEVEFVRVGLEDFRAVLYSQSCVEQMPARVFMRLIDEGEIMGSRNINRARKVAEEKSDAREVFEYWKNVFNKTSSAKLTAERIKLVEARFKDGYTVQDLKDNFTSAALNSWYIENDKTGFDTLLKNPDGIERRINELPKEEIDETPNSLSAFKRLEH